MPDQTGWWTFDGETQTLINRVSDQRIRFESAVDDAGSLLHPPASGPARLRFSYQDAEVRYPVLMTARYETYGGAGFDHGDSRRLSLSWSINHLASAMEWRRAHGADAEIPPYGLWRRVDDALFDALACWLASPSMNAVSPISLTRLRLRERCFGASKPKQSWRRGSPWSRARSEWWKWRSKC